MLWSRLILNNEHTEPQTPWSSEAGTLISVSDGTHGSFPAWQQVCRLRCFHLFGSSCRISEDFVPSRSHLVSSWSTGGYEWPAIILASRLSVCLWNGPWYCYLGGLENQKEQKAKLLACCWSIDDTVPGLHLCPPHLICAASMLGRDKQQRDAPVFPSLSALISKDWVLASRCYNRNHLCSAWDQYLTAGLFSRRIKPLFLHKNSVFSFKTKVGAFPVVQMCS